MTIHKIRSSLIILIIGIIITIVFPMTNTKRDGSTCSHKSFLTTAECDTQTKMGNKSSTNLFFYLSASGAANSNAGIYYKDLGGGYISIVTLDVESVENNKVNGVVTIGHQLSRTPYQIRFAYEPKAETKLEVSINEAKWIRIKLDGNTIQSQRWNSPIFLKYNPRDTVITANNEEYFRAIEINTRTFDLRINYAFLILFVSLLLVFVYKVSVLFSGVSMVESNEEGRGDLRKITLVSLGITFVSITVYKILNLNYQKYFDMNGATFAAAARYSDWYQVFDLAHYSQPYLLGNSNYPPAFLALLRNLPYSLSGSSMILVMAASIGLTANLCSKMFHRNPIVNLSLASGLILFSYPVIFAIDRGSTEFLLSLVLVGFTISLRLERLEIAALLLGLAIALKVYPILLLPIFLLSSKRVKLTLISFVTAAISSVIGSQVITNSPFKGIIDFLKVSSESSIGTQFHNNQNLAARATSIYSWAYNLKVFRVPVSSGDAIPESSVAIIMIMAMVMAIYFVYKMFQRKSSYSSALLAGVVMVLLVTPLSNDYRLILLIPAIVNWYSDSTFRANGHKVWIPLGLILASRPIYYVKESAMTLGSLLTAPLLIIVFVCVLQNKRTEFLNVPKGN